MSSGMKLPLGDTSFSSTWVTFGSWMLRKDAQGCGNEL
jgi:hypothetical protein